MNPVPLAAALRTLGPGDHVALAPGVMARFRLDMDTMTWHDCWVDRDGPRVVGTVVCLRFNLGLTWPVSLGAGLAALVVMTAQGERACLTAEFGVVTHVPSVAPRFGPPS